MSDKPKGTPEFPGIPATADGTAMVDWVETHITDGATAYPITPSTNMGIGYEDAVSNGVKNLWGRKLLFFEPESEHSSASAAEGFAAGGGRVTNFTSGQGLILMKEVLYTISGKRLPVVFNIAARALTHQALNIHAGHDDVMGVADAGWGMLFARNAQETGDLCLIARRTAEDAQTPFLNVQDGFLTTHTVESVVMPEPEFMKAYVMDSRDRLQAILDPENPLQVGVVQNQDAYMKGKIAQRFFTDRVRPALIENLRLFSEKTGRPYGLIDSYKMEDAEHAIVGMGSALETAKVMADWLRANKGLKIGVIHVTAFRPFPGPELVEALQNVKSLAVIERLDNPLALDNPLTAELKTAFANAVMGEQGYTTMSRIPRIYSGSYGLGSRDIKPGDFIAIGNMLTEMPERSYFVVGIDHPLAVKAEANPDVRHEEAFSLRGHSVGGYGSVTTNKIIATVVGEAFGLCVQAYPKYGSEKKGLPTNYFLTISPEKIGTHCELDYVDFVPINDVNAFFNGNPLAGLQEGGTVLLQTDQTDPEEVWKHVPPFARRIIRERNINLYYLDMVAIAREVASSPDLQQRMQGIILMGVFLRHTPFAKRSGMAEDKVFESVEKSLRKYFGGRGEAVIQANMNAVKRGYESAKEVPREIIEKEAAA